MAVGVLQIRPKSSGEVHAVHTAQGDATILHCTPQIAASHILANFRKLCRNASNHRTEKVPVVDAAGGQDPRHRGSEHRPQDALPWLAVVKPLGQEVHCPAWQQ